MRALGRLALSLLGVCSHGDSRRERDAKGVLHFVCHDCGHAVPVIDRTAKERREMSKRYQPVAVSKAHTAPATVTPMRRAR
jgi:predicted RNA-binding Zn-ribbon protein involved in translation (DUF1610 family)